MQLVTNFQVLSHMQKYHLSCCAQPYKQLRSILKCYSEPRETAFYSQVQCLQILEGVVPDLLRKKEEEEKRLRVAQRMQRQMDNILLDENGGFGR